MVRWHVAIEFADPTDPLEGPALVVSVHRDGRVHAVREALTHDLDMLEYALLRIAKEIARRLELEPDMPVALPAHVRLVAESAARRAIEVHR